LEKINIYLKIKMLLDIFEFYSILRQQNPYNSHKKKHFLILANQYMTILANKYHMFFIYN